MMHISLFASYALFNPSLLVNNGCGCCYCNYLATSFKSVLVCESRFIGWPIRKSFKNLLFIYTFNSNNMTENVLICFAYEFGLLILHKYDNMSPSTIYDTNRYIHWQPPQVIIFLSPYKLNAPIIQCAFLESMVY